MSVVGKESHCRSRLEVVFSEPWSSKLLPSHPLYSFSPPFTLPHCRKATLKIHSRVSGRAVSSPVAARRRAPTLNILCFQPRKRPMVYKLWQQFWIHFTTMTKVRPTVGLVLPGVPRPWAYFWVQLHLLLPRSWRLWCIAEVNNHWCWRVGEIGEIIRRAAAWGPKGRSEDKVLGKSSASPSSPVRGSRESCMWVPPSVLGGFPCYISLCTLKFSVHWLILIAC